MKAKFYKIMKNLFLVENMRGLSLVSLIVLVIILIPIMRSGLVLLEYYYEFYELRAQLAQLAKVAPSLSETETAIRLNELLRDMKHVSRDKVEFEWSPSKVRFSARWELPWAIDMYGYKFAEQTIPFELVEETPE